MDDEARIRTAGPLRVAGFLARASNADPSPIGALWRTFAERASELAALGPPHAVYHDYESDHTHPYSLLVGLPVAEDAALPEGWRAVEVPRASYLVFSAPQGPMPGVLIDTWRRIWSHFEAPGPYERTYTFDFERHDPSVEVFVAVRPTQKPPRA